MATIAPSDDCAHRQPAADGAQRRTVARAEELARGDPAEDAARDQDRAGIEEAGQRQGQPLEKTVDLHLGKAGSKQGEQEGDHLAGAQVVQNGGRHDHDRGRLQEGGLPTKGLVRGVVRHCGRSMWHVVLFI